MSSNNFYKSDLPRIFNIVQNTMIRYPKDLVLDVLKKYYEQDTYYRLVRDEFGFVKVTDNTNLPLDAGMKDNLSTRLFVGEQFKKEISMYPSILVKSNSAKYVPISANREYNSVQYDKILFEDSYGNSKQVSIPKYFILAGRWEGSLTIDILTKSVFARDELIELTTLALADIYFDDLVQNGLVIKPPSAGSFSEQESRNDKIFKASITIDYMGEWRREIPINNIVERILFTIDFQNLDSNTSAPAPNLSIVTDVNLTDQILSME